jgi:dTMP kinase
LDYRHDRLEGWIGPKRGTLKQAVLSSLTIIDAIVMPARDLGKLIVFEGGEGCGKTTQLQRTATWLAAQRSALWPQGDVMVTREPGGTALCGQIRHVLLEPTDESMDPRTELLLYAADRAQHVAYCLKPALQRGDLILCDRYTDSTVAYQGYGRGLDRGLIDQLNQIATDGLQPDLTLWLDLDVAVGLARAQRRGQRDRIEQSDMAFHQAVRQGFTELAQAFSDRFVRIDASLELDAVTQQVQAALTSFLRA